MSQTLMFLLFMAAELVAILMLYQWVIIPRVAEKTNNIFEERMLNKTWDIQAMLEDYTIHLADVFGVDIPDPLRGVKLATCMLRKGWSTDIVGKWARELVGV